VKALDAAIGREAAIELSASPRTRVLACAYACHPDGSSGGEDLLGWNLVEQIARFHDVWVLTSDENHGAIERRLSTRPMPSAHFSYVRLPPPFTMLRRFLRGGIQVYVYLWQLRLVPIARRLHRRHGFDLFHHVTYANDWMASFVGALLRLPYLRGPGGGAQKIPAPFLKEFSFKGKCWEQLRSLGQWLFRHDPMYLMGQARAQAILICNPDALQRLPARWRSKSTLFPVNGISESDLDAPTQTAPMVPIGTMPPRRFKILSAGKLLQLKGFALAIRAFRQLADRHADVEFEIVGSGPDRPLLERTIRSSGLVSRVRLSPWMTRPQFLTALRSCDVFVFPGLRDGGGAVVIEAMAAGKPVVCFTLGGPALHVTDDCGISVPARNATQAVATLADALERLYDDEGLRLRFGRAARTRAETAYHWDRLGERLLAVYQEVLRSAQSAHMHGAA